jgi:hypothetical protein
MSRQLELTLRDINLGPSEVADFATTLARQYEKFDDGAVIIGAAGIPHGDKLLLRKDPCAGTALGSRTDVHGGVGVAVATVDGPAIKSRKGNSGTIGSDLMLKPIDNDDHVLARDGFQDAPMKGLPVTFKVALCLAMALRANIQPVGREVLFRPRSSGA